MVIFYKGMEGVLTCAAAPLMTEMRADFAFPE